MRWEEEGTRVEMEMELSEAKTLLLFSRLSGWVGGSEE